MGLFQATKLFQARRYAARLATSDGDLLRCQQLRYRAFIEGRGLAGVRGRPRLDADEFDARCRHVMIEDAVTGALVGCFRILPLANGSQIGGSYAARHYDLSRLARYRGRMIEMGRFCIHPVCRDPNILWLAWATLSRMVDEAGVELVFGCSSFHGTDAERYAEAFALLKEEHLSPRRWLLRVKAPRVFPYARVLGPMRPDRKAALRRMPPLLRSYLAMGGWVSDHAVIDAELNTLHVFTGVEVARVPLARARLLRRAGAGSEAPARVAGRAGGANLGR